MSVTANLLTNPGFESDLTGWTSNVSDPVNSTWSAPTTPTPHAGSKFAQFGTNVSGAYGTLSQILSVSAYASEIAAGHAVAHASVFFGASTASAIARLLLTFYSSPPDGITGAYSTEISSSPGYVWSAFAIEGGILVPAGTTDIGLALYWQVNAATQGGGYDDASLTLTLNENTAPSANRLLAIADSLGF
jgi:hypothetical protein